MKIEVPKRNEVVEYTMTTPEKIFLAVVVSILVFAFVRTGGPRSL